MKGFVTAFSLESKKIFSSKGFWIFIVAILVLCLMVTLSFKMIGDLMEGMDDTGLTGSGADAGQLVEVYRQQLDEYLQQVESGQIKQKPGDTTEMTLRNSIAICEYCIEHGIDVNSLVAIGSISSFNMTSGDFVNMMSQVSFTFVCILAIVISARTLAGEIDDGTMRMQLTRPIKRYVLLLAKQGAVFVAGLTVAVAFMAAFMAGGALFFEGTATDVVLVDAYQNVAVINPYAAILLTFLFFAVELATMIQFTMFIGSFVNKTGALAIPLVTYLFVDTIALLLYNTGLPWIGLFTNLNWASGLTTAGAPVRGMSIYTMMAITAVWFAGMTAVNYTVFEKRDLK